MKRINDLSDHTLIGALERGKLIEFGLATRQLSLTQASLDQLGIHIPVRSAKAYIQLATHKPNCSEATHSRNHKRYGTKDGEQAIVDDIRLRFEKGESYRGIAKDLNSKGILPRTGRWGDRMIARIIGHAEKGEKPREPCTCRMFRLDWVKPQSWDVCLELLKLSHRTFEAMLAAGGIHYWTTLHDIRAFRRSMYERSNESSGVPSLPKDQHEINFLNQIIDRDCVELIPLLTPKSIGVVVTSPPFALQRDHINTKDDLLLRDLQGGSSRTLQ